MSSKLCIFPIIIHFLLLMYSIYHTLHLIYIFRIQIKCFIKIRKCLSEFTKLLVYLANVYMNGCFFRHFLIQGKEEVQCFLIALHAQKNLGLLVLIQRVARVYLTCFVEASNRFLKVILVMLS